VAALPQLGDGKKERADAIAVAPTETLRTALTMRSSGLGLDLDFHNLPKNRKQSFAKEVELATLSQLAEQFLAGDNGIGHRSFLLHRYTVSSPIPARTLDGSPLLGWPDVMNDFLLHHVRGHYPNRTSAEFRLGVYYQSCRDRHGRFRLHPESVP